MATIDRYMTESPHTVGSAQPLAFAAELRHEHGVRHLPVLKGGQLLGVVSDRDLHIIKGLDVDPSKISVEEAIPLAPYVVAPDVPLAEVASHMAEHKFGSAVVMDHNQVVGIFTTVDAARALAELASK